MSALIRLDQVQHHHPFGDSEVRALRGVSLVIERGDYVSVLGPSGSGKSTLLYLIGCLDRPSAGRYWFDGKAVDGLSDAGLARLRSRRIGFVFPSFSLVPRLDLVQNVELPLAYRGVPRARRRELAAAMLSDVGLGSHLSRRPGELSGGECQRVAIARALVGQPDVLLADEPTGNLDSATGDEILDLLARLHAGGTTLVLVTHDVFKARRARRLIQLRDGCVAREFQGGTGRSVRDRPRRARRRRLLGRSRG